MHVRLPIIGLVGRQKQVSFIVLLLRLELAVYL